MEHPGRCAAGKYLSISDASPAARAPWMSVKWLGDVLFALTWQTGGLRGLQALLATSSRRSCTFLI